VISPTLDSDIAVAKSSPLPDNQLGISWMEAAISAQLSDVPTNAPANPREELERYLSAPLENDGDIIRWWGVCDIISL
jgi:hypothetical protein